MKSQSHALTASFIGVVSLFAANTLTAIEPAPDNAKPPAELEDRVEKPNEAEAKMPFMGVVTAILPEMVADHLNLKAGTGVIVRTVSPDSPAEKSGIKVNDIILNINETAVNDPEAFRAEISSHKIGDKLKLKTIQKGKPKDLEITLMERPANAFADAPDAGRRADRLPRARQPRRRRCTRLCRARACPGRWLRARSRAHGRAARPRRAATRARCR